MMTENKKTKALIIGCGKMGGSLLKSMADSGLYNIYVVDTDESRRKYASRCGAEVFSKLEGAPSADIYILAVKPQEIDAVLKKIKSSVLKGRLLISIAAGISIEHIKSYIDSMPVVRAMPNTPLAVGEGMTALCVSDAEPPEAAEEALHLFSLSGAAEIINENIIDAVTAVSGSGPAYFILLAGEMKKFLSEKGMDEAQASSFAARTVLGSGKLMADSEQSFEQLIKNVVSPGGTTEAALNHIEKKGLKKIFYKAMEKALKRARELSKEEGQ